MGVPAAHVMALGDGENDVEMLQLAGVRQHAPHARVRWTVQGVSTSKASGNSAHLLLFLKVLVLT